MIPVMVALPLLFAFLFTISTYSDIDEVFREALFLTGIFSPIPVFLFYLDDLPFNTVLGGWTRVSGIEVGLDGINYFFLSAAFIVFGLVAIYSLTYFDRIENIKGSVSKNSKFTLILLLYAGVLGSFITRDLFDFAVYMEIASISAIILVASSSSKRSKLASFRYLILYLLSSFFFIFSLGIIYVKTGYLNFHLIEQSIVLDLETKVAISLAFIALITKAGIFPLHFWLPEAHSRADTPVSALLSGITVKVPIYGMILFLQYTPVGFLTLPLMVVAFTSMILGIVMALLQKNAKKLLAYHTVSQMGIILLAVSVLDAYAAAHYVLAHSLFKSGLFLAVGVSVSSYGTRDLKKLSFGGKRSLMISVVILSLAIGGISPLIGAFGKHEIMAEISEIGVYLIYAGSIGTLISFSKLNYRLFKSGDDSEIKKDHRWEIAISFVLALLTIGFGIYYYPKLYMTDILLLITAVAVFFVLKYLKVLEWKLPRYYEKNTRGLAEQINLYTAVFVFLNISFLIVVLSEDIFQMLPIP